LPVARAVRGPAELDCLSGERELENVMVEKQKQPESELTTDEGHNAHPVEPAEGAREPGVDADEPRPPHPDEPVEGER
jgi:hypothetical protein